MGEMGYEFVVEESRKDILIMDIIYNRGEEF